MPASCTSAPNSSFNGSVDDPHDPFALVRIEGDALASEPSRLVEEAHTVPLFGGRRAVWIKAGSRNFAAAVEMWWQAPPVDCRIVIEAGDLKRNAPLRAICEKARSAAALPCYADNERDLARLIDDEMRDAKLTIAPDARAALVSLIGGDRQASRSEIRKLALYAHGKDRVELEDVIAVVADASALGLDAVVDAAFAGARRAEAQFAKALAAGTSSGSIVVARCATSRNYTRRGLRSMPASAPTRRSTVSFRRYISAGRHKSNLRCPPGRRRGLRARWMCLPPHRLRCAERQHWPTRSANARYWTLPGRAQSAATDKRQSNFFASSGSNSPSSNTKATTQGAFDRLLHAWLVPHCTRTSPALSSTSPSSSSMVISPA